MLLLLLLLHSQQRPAKKRISDTQVRLDVQRVDCILSDAVPSARDGV